MKIIAYHGTTERARLSIEDVGITVKRRGLKERPSWLGLGFYMFQDAPRAASSWALECSRRRGGEKPVVMKATVDLRNSVDFTDVSYWSLLRESLSSLGLPSRPQLGPEALFRERTQDETDRLYYNYEDDHFVTGFVSLLEKQGEAVSSIRGAFIEGAPIHPTSWLFDRSHVQICVRDPAIVDEVVWLQV